MKVNMIDTLEPVDPNKSLTGLWKKRSKILKFHLAGDRMPEVLIDIESLFKSSDIIRLTDSPAWQQNVYKTIDGVPYYVYYRAITIESEEVSQ